MVAVEGNGDVAALGGELLSSLGLDPDVQLARSAAAMPWNAEPGDFESPDGTLVCGFCGKPKQTADGFPIVHSHQLASLVRHEETQAERAERILRNRGRCFAGEFRGLEGCTLATAAEDTDRDSAGAVMAYSRDFRAMRKAGHGLLLFGPVGRGKTFLAACLCNVLLDGGWRCLMTSTRRIRSQVEGAYGSLNSVVESLCRHDLVVLDDLFRDRNTETGREIVFDVVDALYKARVPMVVTTNLSGDSIRYPSQADQPVVDRLKERCRRVEMPASLPNRRQVAAC